MTVGVGQNLTGKISRGILPQTLHVSVAVAFGEAAALVEHYSEMLQVCCCPGLYCCFLIVLANCVNYKHASKYKLT